MNGLISSRCIAALLCTLVVSNAAVPPSGAAMSAGDATPPSIVFASQALQPFLPPYTHPATQAPSASATFYARAAALWRRWAGDRDAAVRERTIAQLRAVVAEGGLHTTTGGRGLAEVPLDTLEDFAKTLTSHGFMPAVDQLELVTRLRRAKPHSLIAFLYEGQAQWTLFAVVSGAPVVAGPVLPDAYATALRKSYPYVVMIYEIADAVRDGAGWQWRPEEDVLADVQTALTHGVEGILLKPYFRAGTSWAERFPTGPLSLTSLQQAAPGWLIMGAGGIFETTLLGAMLQAPTLIPAVGFNSRTLEAFEAQAADYRSIQRLGRVLRGDFTLLEQGRDFSVAAWGRLSLDQQRQQAAAVAAALAAVTSEWSVRLDAELAAGEPVRLSIVPRRRVMSEADPFETLKSLMDDQRRTIDPKGASFFKVWDDGRTIDLVRHPIPGHPGQFIEHLVNADLASKPGAGHPSPTCVLCQDVIRSKFPDELWAEWGPFSLYFNPFPIWAATHGAALEDIPYHLVAAWSDTHRSQRQAIDYDVVNGLRNRWMRLNASPSLAGRLKFRLFINGWAHGSDPDRHGGASQDHVHGQLVRYLFAGETADVRWEGTAGHPDVRQGRVALVPAVDGGEDVQGIALESTADPQALRALDILLAGRLHAITERGDSFNVFFFETPKGRIRVHVVARTLGRPEGASGRGSPQILARYNVIPERFERFFDYTEALSRELAGLSNGDAKQWLKEAIGAGRLRTQEAGRLYALYLDQMRQISYRPSQYDALMKELSIHITDSETLAPGLAVRRVSASSQEMSAHGEAFVVDLGGPYTAVQKFSEEVRTRDVFAPPLEPHEPGIGLVAEDYFAEQKPVPHLVVNTTQGHFWDPATLLIMDGHAIVKAEGKRGMQQDVEGYKPVEGPYTVINLGAEGPRMADVIVDKGRIVGRSPIANGFGGVRLLENGVDRVDQIRFNARPARLGNELGWASRAQRHAFTVFGYNRERPQELVIVQTMGNPADASKQEMTIDEMVALLKRLGVTDAILGGTSGDATRYCPLLSPAVVQAQARPGSRFQTYAARQEDGRRRVGTAVGFFPVSPRGAGDRRTDSQKADRALQSSL